MAKNNFPHSRVKVHRINHRDIGVPLAHLFYRFANILKRKP